MTLTERGMQLAGLVLVLSGAATAGVAAAAVAGARDECDAFRFERSHWREALRNPDDGPGGTSKAEDPAAAVVRCGTLDGATEAEVRRALGRPTSTWRGRLLWYVGWTNDAIGPGDAQELVVEFERDNAQARVYLAAP